jgi:hypothetical protein
MATILGVPLGGQGVSRSVRAETAQTMSRSQARALLLGALVVSLATTGCGSGEPYGLGQIAGTVKYEDGSLIRAPRITVLFVPQAPPVDSKTFPRPGSVDVNVADGTFSGVTTYEPGDGAVLGEHKVVVRATGENDFPSPAVPREYADAATTTLKVTVSSGANAFELKIPKPK